MADEFVTCEVIMAEDAVFKRLNAKLCVKDEFKPAVGTVLTLYNGDTLELKVGKAELQFRGDPPYVAKCLPGTWIRPVFGFPTEKFFRDFKIQVGKVWKWVRLVTGHPEEDLWNAENAVAGVRG